MNRGGNMLGLGGKTALVFGVASDDSIAWAICKRLADAGCDIHLGFQKRFMSRIFQLRDQLDAIQGTYPMDVAQEETTAEFFSSWQADRPGEKADVLIHAIGWAPRSTYERPLLFVDNESLNAG
ncbi:MAG TPA: SDR family oxidoreductase, partial [Candidatus Poseidoniales archaeon]|nr:SDR family oxidoreductase [Candidatus Poseidoniales archaeon]